MKNIIDIEKLELNINKIKMFNKEESISNDLLKNSFKNMNTTLDISGSSKLENIQFEILRKFKTVKKIHSNNIIVLDKNVNKYIVASNKSNQIFDNIKKG